jgi:thiol-disulfide isomerase/thioredoxin
MKIKIFTVILLFILLSWSKAMTQEVVTLNKISDLDAIRNANAGKVLLVNLWASWCKPCVEEFPHLVKLYNDYKVENFELILISLDFKEEIDSKVIPFLKKNNIDFPTYYIDAKNNVEDIINYFDKKWEGAIPATFIYDRNNKMVETVIGGHNYSFFETLIRKIL